MSQWFSNLGIITALSCFFKSVLTFLRSHFAASLVSNEASWAEHPFWRASSRVYCPTTILQAMWSIFCFPFHDKPTTPRLDGSSHLGRGGLEALYWPSGCSEGSSCPSCTSSGTGTTIPTDTTDIWHVQGHKAPFGWRSPRGTVSSPHSTPTADTRHIDTIDMPGIEHIDTTLSPRTARIDLIRLEPWHISGIGLHTFGPHTAMTCTSPGPLLPSMLHKAPQTGKSQRKRSHAL